MARKKIEIVLIEIDGEQIEAKECTKCGEVKALSEYNSNGRGGCRSDCKECVKNYREENKEEISARMKKYYEENKEELVARYKNYYEENKEKEAARFKKYQQENKEVMATIHHRRYARKRQLPDTLTADQTAELLRNGCALTGAHDNIHLDHFIPLAWGHGGTIIENMIPLEGWLNMSKNDANPFEWVKREDVQQRISMSKWYETIEYLAELNDMTPQEYEEYVYWCEENKRDLVAEGA